MIGDECQNDRTGEECHANKRWEDCHAYMTDDDCQTDKIVEECHAYRRREDCVMQIRNKKIDIPCATNNLNLCIIKTKPVTVGPMDHMQRYSCTFYAGIVPKGVWSWEAAGLTASVPRLSDRLTQDIQAHSIIVYIQQNNASTHRYTHSVHYASVADPDPHGSRTFAGIQQKVKEEINKTVNFGLFVL